MNEQDTRRQEEFERRTKKLFDDSAAALDGATRSRLTQARHRALAQLVPASRRGWRWVLVPAGSVAAAALAAWLLIGQGLAPTETSLQAASLNDLEILLAEEDLEMLDEELEFYGWLEEQPEFANVDDSVG